MRILLLIALLIPAVLFAAENDWPGWRGPNNDGMARGDVPLEWSEGKNIAWRVAIPGRGFSSPVIWGDKIFLTTAIPTDGAPPLAESQQDGRGPGGGVGVGREHRFVVLCLSRQTGKVLWSELLK